MPLEITQCEECGTEVRYLNHKPKYCSFCRVVKNIEIKQNFRARHAHIPDLPIMR